MVYIWQRRFWTDFHWDPGRILKSLSDAKLHQGYISGQSGHFDLKNQSEIILEEAFSTSAIEGETLDRNTIRSSIAKRLGLPTAGLPDVKRNSDGLVELLLDATRNYHGPLTRERLYGWQASLFPTGYSGIYKIKTGAWRDSKTPMQVVSGSMGKEKVHYEAPPSDRVDDEINRFLTWWNSPPDDLDGLLRAGIAHFWFVTIHPFDDGNGRIARAVTDMALAQDEKSGTRLYSLSSQIIKDRNNYYEILEKTQKGSGDLTEWLCWFLDTVSRSIDKSKTMIEKSLFIGRVYKKIVDISLNDRQKKVLGKLLERLPEDLQGGLTNKKYVSMTKTSPETAKRDLKDMVEKGLLIPGEAGGRSMHYLLNRIIS